MMDKQGYMHARPRIRPRARAHAISNTRAHVIFIAFPRQHWFVNAPQCYVICTLSVLFYFHRIYYSRRGSSYHLMTLNLDNSKVSVLQTATKITQSIVKIIVNDTSGKLQNKRTWCLWHACYSQHLNGWRKTTKIPGQKCQLSSRPLQTSKETKISECPRLDRLPVESHSSAS